MAIGAYVTAIATVSYGWDFWPATALAIVIVSVTGAIMALPALRVSSWYLALLTFGFAGVVNATLIEWSGLTGGFSGLIGVPMPTFFGRNLDQTSFFWLVAGLNVIVFVMIRNLVRSRYGRGLVAIRDNPMAAVASGVPRVRLTLFAFVVSAILAGLAGAIFAAQKQVITPDDFAAEMSMFFLLVIIMGGAGSLWGPVIGTIVFFVLPELMTGLASWRMLVYGVGLLVLITYAPHGLEGALRSLWAYAPDWLRLPHRQRAGEALTGMPVRAGASRPLTVTGLTKNFGGVTAIDAVDLSIAAASCHAIVGPNGSGKTTLLNLISGYYAPTKGHVRLGEEEIGGRSAAALSLIGIGRTFQTPRLLPDMSVLDNVLLGCYPAEKASALGIALGLPGPRAEAARMEAEALGILAFVGLADKADDLAGNVPHGQQRIVEIARALMGKPGLLLLDEPAAGLSMDELDRLVGLIRSIQESGITLVIVEHHLDLVGSLADAVTVIDRGKILAQGSAEDVFSEPAVVAAYMGRRPADGRASGKEMQP
jgi:ABC-type branched-subunit amino acid transport system ATPase component/ABC-type branched-subunit amino acid transport system permease subunit